tara:strand:+ start:836 stop:1315 length:480 start_codon:yes stop_codon:yes gene_type:complete
MATRNLTMVVNRRHARNNPNGLAINPSSVSEYSFVNMYLHHDGYPEWQAVQLANWLKVNNRQDGSAMAAKLVHDHYYDSCYLYPDPDNIDHQYTYIIWTGDSSKTMIACHDRYSEQCIFVMTPEQIIEKYKDDMKYTDFAAGETRCEYSGLRSVISYTD